MTIQAQLVVAKDEFTLDVDLRIPDKGITALFGPSGSGKTTLLRAIAGLESGADGVLTLADQCWQNPDSFVPPHQRSVGYVFQEASLFAHLSVRGNLDYGAKRATNKASDQQMAQTIELLGIGHLLLRRIDQLSGGERQRVAIARALAINPDILLMDEPLAALDLARKQEIMPYLESLHDELEIPVVYVSHSPDEVAQLADHLVFLDDGKVKAAGPISDMLTRLDLPLAQGNDAEALIEAVVVSHDDDYGLTYLDFPGGRFTVSKKALPIGCSVRLRVAARDVSLTLEHQSNTSILNIFPVVVDEVSNGGATQVTVRLLAGDTVMLSRITRKSADLLALEPGKAVFAQAKSVALLA